MFYRNGKEHIGNEIYRLKPGANAWEKMEISMQKPRNFHETIAIDPTTIDCSSGFLIRLIFIYISRM